jgi:hypothetical protein
MPHLVQRRYHAGVVLLGPPSDAGWEDGKWGKRRGKGRDGYQRRWLCLRDGWNHGGGRGFAVVVVDDEAGSEIDENVAEDASWLCAEEADVVGMTEVIDLQGHIERWIWQDHHLSRIRIVTNPIFRGKICKATWNWFSASVVKVSEWTWMFTYGFKSWSWAAETSARFLPTSFSVK